MAVHSDVTLPGDQHPSDDRRALRNGLRLNCADDDRAHVRVDVHADAAAEQADCEGRDGRRGMNSERLLQRLQLRMDDTVDR